MMTQLRYLESEEIVIEEEEIVEWDEKLNRKIDICVLRYLAKIAESNPCVKDFLPFLSFVHDDCGVHVAI